MKRCRKQPIQKAKLQTKPYLLEQAVWLDQMAPSMETWLHFFCCLSSFWASRPTRFSPASSPPVRDSPSACLSAQAHLTRTGTCPLFLLSNQVCFLHLLFSHFHLSWSKSAAGHLASPCDLSACWSLVLHCSVSEPQAGWEVFDRIHYEGLTQQF